MSSKIPKRLALISTATLLKKNFLIDKEIQKWWSSSFMTTLLHISLYITKPFLIYDFESDLFYFLLRKESFLFFFNSVEHPLCALYVLKGVFSDRGKTSNK